MKTGLVLEGGGMRGLYTAGVLDALMEQDIQIDGVVSVSAGALFGVNLLSKQPGRALRYNLKYIADKRYMGLGHLLRTGNVINQQFAYYEVPFKLDVFDQGTFAKAKIPFYVVITNVETGQAEYVNIVDVFQQMEVLRATSSMPLVSQMVDLNGVKYLDGGIADSIPVEFAQSLGFDKLIVVLTRPKAYRKKRSNIQLIRNVYRAYPNLVTSIQNRYRVYNQTLDTIEDLTKKGQVYVIQPSRTIKVKRIEKNPKRLEAIHQLGYQDFQSQASSLMKYLNKLSES
ncbi:patatin-like phospholipase family protein [Vaginisenegalia massiliensis]|uniref:patatin-like phospholipase family protein n=1 Tax=Vaginisenegalia massiliensis TaxID=2058294 RepID=UPI000F525B11|nr:patatin-like phospholipase family protein [Vaginisenegalia massiliensis]